MLLFGAISYDLFVFKSRFILGNVWKMFLKKADSIFQFVQWKLKIYILMFDSEPCERLSSIRWGSKNCQFMNSIFVTLLVSSHSRQKPPATLVTDWLEQAALHTDCHLSFVSSYEPFLSPLFL